MLVTRFFSFFFQQNSFFRVINSLPNDKILALTMFKAFADDKIRVADDKIRVTQKLKFELGSVENIVGKGENDSNQHFLPFPQCFLKFFSQRCQKLVLCGNGLNDYGLRIMRLQSCILGF